MIKYIEENVMSKLEVKDRERFKLDNGNFKEVDEYLLEEFFPEVCERNRKFDCVFADFGYSMEHIKNTEWGFGYSENCPLDMRYDQNKQKTTAADILNKASTIELKEIFHRYGDEPASELIAQAIVTKRTTKPFKTANDLNAIIFEKFKTDTDAKYKISSRVFQALRIAVNMELDNIAMLMQKSQLALNKGGIGIYITFHSLEEKLVTSYLGKLRREKKIEVVERGVRPDAGEIEENKMSRSAKLFCFRKIVR